jgi:hypothetical protein
MTVTTNTTTQFVKEMQVPAARPPITTIRHFLFVDNSAAFN